MITFEDRKIIVLDDAQDLQDADPTKELMSQAWNQGPRDAVFYAVVNLTQPVASYILGTQ